jgi:hypothetical protein
MEKTKEFFLGLVSVYAAGITIGVVALGIARSANEAAYRQLENTTRVLALNYLAARPDANPSAFDEAVANILIEGNAKKDGACICVPNAVVAFNRRYVFPADGNQSHRLALAQGEPAKAPGKIRVASAVEAQTNDLGEGGPGKDESRRKANGTDIRVAAPKENEPGNGCPCRGTEKPTDRDGLSRHDIGKKRKHEEKLRA